MTAPTAAALASDRFPVHVQALEGDVLDVRTARAIIDDSGRLRVYTAPDVVVADALLDPARCLVGAVQVEWRVTTTDSVQYLIRPQRGCGCSNPLKTWKPDREQVGS